MQVDFNKVVTDINENDIETVKGDKLILKDIVIEALMSQHGGQSGVDKLKKVTLAQLINKTPVQEIDADDCNMMIDLIEKSYGPLIYYRAIQVLDPKRLDVK